MSAEVIAIFAKLLQQSRGLKPDFAKEVAKVLFEKLYTGIANGEELQEIDRLGGKVFKIDGSNNPGLIEQSIAEVRARN